MPAALVRAQAKINLFLRVVGREASGYHALETLFCRVDLADVVTVRLTPSSRSLDCLGPALPARGLGTVAANLAWRAAVAYAGVARWPAGFTIELEKHIPVSAGLGGGSADAGAVLRALNALNPRPLGRHVLQDLARSLGADVPFLTQDQAVLALGARRGDEWSPLDALPVRACILAIPPIGVSTRDAYAWIDEARGWTDDETFAPRREAHVPDGFTWDDACRLAHNDFEAVVFPRCPEVAAAWRYVADMVARIDAAGCARLSGSGAAVFGILGSAERPTVAFADAPAGVQTTITQTAARVESVQLID